MKFLSIQTIGWIIVLLLVQQLIAADQTEREWETADGKFKVTAKFKEFNEKENKVVLIKKDGKEISVPVAKLSKADQGYIKKSAGNKKSDVDAFGENEGDAKSAENSKPPAKSGETKAKTPSTPTVLSVEDEKLAKELFEQVKSAYKPVKQPKWEKVWSVHLKSKILETDFSQDGKTMAAVNDQGECEIRNLKTGELLKTGDKDLLGRVKKVAISPDAKYIVNVTGKNTLFVWELETGKEGHVFKNPESKENFQKGIASIAFSQKDEQIAFLDNESTFYRYPRLGGYGNFFSLKDKDDPMYGRDRFSISPDFKKVVTWKQRGSHAEYMHIDDAVEKKKRNTTSYDLSDKNDQLAGGLCTNECFVNINLYGKISWSSTNYAQDMRPLVPRGYQTSFRSTDALSVTSWDAKKGAFFCNLGILAFPAHNPGVWKVFAPPPGKLERYGVWLLRDFEHFVAIDDQNNLVMWKSNFAEQISDVPLMAELVEKKKFNAIDRTYFMFDNDPELEKYAIIAPWTERLLNLLNDSLTFQQGKEGSKTISDFLSWSNNNPENTIGLLQAASVATAEAWRARGGGFASTVTEEGWKVYREKMAVARTILLPILKRDHVPADAIPDWISVCKAVGWNHDDVDLGISALLKHHPLHRESHYSIMYSLLPRWFGEVGDCEKYAEKVTELKEGQFKDAMYYVAMSALIRGKKSMDPKIIFDEEKNPTLVYDDIKIDWARALRGADELIAEFPDDPAGASIGLKCSVEANDIEAASKYLKILYEKHSGIPSPYSKMTTLHVFLYKLAIEQAKGN